MLIKRAISRLAISYDFFNAEFISFEVKIHAARAMIISMLSYGQDIIYLNESQSQRLNSALARTLRRIFRQPRSTKIEALQIMAGIPSMSSIYMAHRTSNFIRIAIFQITDWLRFSLIQNIKRTQVLQLLTFTRRIY